jgi:predicted SAM-dependent methyltransferase
MSEAAKCKNRIMSYLIGKNVVDIGVDDDKICKWAIGIDLYRVTDDVNLVGDATNLYWFKDNSIDVVFSSHTLEDIQNTERTLIEWLRIVKRGGYLILYIPHKNFYPNIGQPYANAGHKHDFLPEDIIKIMNGIGGTKLISNNSYGPPDGKYNYENRHKIEYSFEQVWQKL